MLTPGSPRLEESPNNFDTALLMQEFCCGSAVRTTAEWIFVEISIKLALVNETLGLLTKRRPQLIVKVRIALISKEGRQDRPHAPTLV